MKNKLTILTVIMVMLLITMPVFAKESKIGILINNEIKVIPQEMGQPFSMDSRTFVPLRFVSENLGFKVDWDSKTQTATVHSNDGKIDITIGKENITTPKGVVKMDVKPFIKDGRTYVPVRFVAEALNFEVDWIPANKMKDSKKYPYDFYVSIDGKLGNSANNTSESGITNIVSDNPADWAKTDNEYQKDYELSRNKELMEYLDKNHSGNFFVGGYSILGDIQTGPALAFDSQGADHTSYTIMDLSVLDLRDSPEDGYWKYFVRNYENSKDVLQKTLYATIGQTDGNYIFNYYTKGRTESVAINEWVRTPSGREFQIRTGNAYGGVHILIK